MTQQTKPNGIIDKRMKINKTNYEFTKPPKELDNLNIFKNRLEELELIKSRLATNLKAKKDKLEKEIEEYRQCLNTYLESSYDIEDFSIEDIYFEIINRKDSVNIICNFLINLKDYWKLKANLTQLQEIADDLGVKI